LRDLFQSRPAQVVVIACTGPIRNRDDANNYLIGVLECCLSSITPLLLLRRAQAALFSQPTALP
jgi:hypothetical protein